MKVGRRSRRAAAPLLRAIPLLFATLFAGCSGSISGGAGPVPGQNTQITLVLTSTANDQFAEFGVGFTGITLKNKSGQSVSLLSQNQGAEFIHLNGAAEPLLTTTIPQDVYTSASITYNAAGVEETFINSSGMLNLNQYIIGLPAQSATVNLPAGPLTVSGKSMVLSLGLLVSQSVVLSSSSPGAPVTYSGTPTFNLSPLSVAPQPTNYLNGKMTGITGSILSVNSSGFTLRLDDYAGATVVPYTLAYAVDNTTMFQGINSLASLAAGTSVNIDAQFQPDGSLLATRVYVPDSSAADTMQGPILSITNIGIAPLGLLEDGQEYSTQSWPLNSYSYQSNTVFHISPTDPDLSSLPFSAIFNASSTAIGQNVSVSSASVGGSVDGNTAASTITLMPQTIDATVTAVSTASGYSVYTVALASNDTIVALGGASQVVVYVGSSTQTLNTSPIAAGSVLRFSGLLFNDNGILRMDCSLVSDGVAT